MKKLVVTILTMALLALCSFAGVAPEATVEGIIVGFNEKTVQLNSNGKVVTVPRTAISKYHKIKGGNKVTAVLDSSEVKRKIDSRTKK